MSEKPQSEEFRATLQAAILNAAPDGILVVDADNAIVLVNQRFFRVWDIPCPAEAIEEVIDRDDAPILEQAVARTLDPETFLARVRELYQHPELEDVCEIPLKDGRTLERHSTALRGFDGRYLGRVWYFRDVSVHKQLAHALNELAHRDALTGIANRRQFFLEAAAEFERARRNGRTLSVVMLDIDSFKQINDRWGHATGDLILQGATRAWRRALRVQDVLARLGGEEFAVLLPETDALAAEAACERLRLELAAAAFDPSQPAARCTASAGIAELCASDASFEACLKRADAALYGAKRAGRDRVRVAERGASP